LTVDDAWCEALFASALQRSAAPAAGSVAAAISRAVRRFGIRGCVSRMAQEFGDHPQAAAERMRWGCSQGKPRTRQRHAEERNLWASRSKTSSNKYRPPPDPADLIGHRVIAGRNSS